MPVICGIDPGLTGGIAVLCNGAVLHLGDLPVHSVQFGKTRRAELDLGGLRDMLVGYAPDHVAIEAVHAMPKQGVTSMFRFGYVAGAITGIVAGLRLPYSLVTPQMWQRLVKCGPAPDMARQRAGQLYPDSVARLSRKRDAGRADALLIAHAWSMQDIKEVADAA